MKTIAVIIFLGVAWLLLWRRLRRPRLSFETVVRTGWDYDFPPPEKQLDDQISRLPAVADPVQRHFLYLGIVEIAYGLRKREEIYADLCVEYGVRHIAEFPGFLKPLVKSLGGYVPRVPTFQHLATVYSERGQFDEAIRVCHTALQHGLHDNTISGFEGRIERIEKIRGKRAK